MSRGYKIAGWIIFSPFIAFAAFVWHEYDPASIKLATIWGAGLWFGYQVIQSVIVKPIMFELNELHRRLDVMEGRDPRPSKFN